MNLIYLKLMQRLNSYVKENNESIKSEERKQLNNIL